MSLRRNAYVPGSVVMAMARITRPVLPQAAFFAFFGRLFLFTGW
jgi:hypothetical protein